MIRPLLSFYKKDFPEIEHFEDATNKENHYLRNRVRNLYLPQLEKENVQVKKAILEFGKEVSDYQIALTELSQTVNVEDLTQFLSFSEATQRVLQLHSFCTKGISSLKKRLFPLFQRIYFLLERVCSPYFKGYISKLVIGVIRWFIYPYCFKG